MAERNVYADTALRMAHDSEFVAAVTMLVKFAEQCGFTPGELKQIAFRAAWEVEMRNPRPIRVSREEWDEMQEELRRSRADPESREGGGEGKSNNAER